MALGARFSPDGSRIAYTERNCSVKRKDAGPGFTIVDSLHIIDLPAKKDATVFAAPKNSIVNSVRWLNDNSKLVVLYSTYGRSTVVPSAKLVQRQGDAWTVADRAITVPKIEQNEGVGKFAQRFMKVLDAHRAGKLARDMHQFEEAKKQYALARDLADALMQDIERHAGEGVNAVKLQPSDVEPYRDAMAKKAAVSVQDLTEQVVKDNLQSYVAYALSGYYTEHDRFPPGEHEAAAQPATAKPLPTFEQFCKNPPEFGTINGVTNANRDLVRRWFVVPGDNPEKKATSYEVVSSGKDSLVLRTPVLPSGNRFEATYKVGEDSTFEYQGKKHRHVSVKATIAEVKQ
jgi:hypothetical protein